MSIDDEIFVIKRKPFKDWNTSHTPFYWTYYHTWHWLKWLV